MEKLLSRWLASRQLTRMSQAWSPAFWMGWSDSCSWNRIREPELIKNLLQVAPKMGREHPGEVRTADKFLSNCFVSIFYCAMWNAETDFGVVLGNEIVITWLFLFIKTLLLLWLNCKAFHLKRKRSLIICKIYTIESLVNVCQYKLFLSIVKCHYSN